MKPIFIPSKGRPNDCFVSRLLSRLNTPHTIVVEPQDFNQYNQVHQDNPLVNIMSLDENNQGLSYARNFIKAYCAFDKIDFHWQIDDDVTRFSVKDFYGSGKNVGIKTRQALLAEMENVERHAMKHHNVPLAGLRDMIFNWTQKEYISLNKQVASVMFIRSDSPYSFSPEMIEDTDFALQVLFNGECTVIHNWFNYSKKPNKSTGGLEGGQNTERYDALVKNLVMKWKDVLKLRRDKKTGSLRVAPSHVWRRFPQVPV